MSTTSRQRTVDQRAGGNGGAPARRAVVRWAWRLFRREWRQQLLVLALITVAVAATILGAAVVTNTPPPANTGFGRANHLITLPGSDSHLATDIATIKSGFGNVDEIDSQNIATGLVQGAQLRAQDPHGAYGQPMLALVSGHYPSGTREGAMTRRLASTLNVHIGDLWRATGRPLRIVGLVENPQNLLDDFALVAPGQLDSPSQVTVLFDATTASAFTFPRGLTAVTPQPSGGIAPAVVVLAIAVVGLIFVGLVAVAGFTVLAQRRLRGLGMLSSLGATDRNVRLVMVANGAVVGVVGALLGAVLGIGAWIAYVPRLAISAHHRVAWTHLPWWLVFTAMVLALSTATLASRRPARAVAGTSVVAALSGRPAPARQVRRSAVPGIVLLVLGPVLLAFSGGWSGNGGKDTSFQLVGLLASAVGLLLLAPVTVVLLGANARRAPIAVRIALRDLSRYRARSGAALAATSFAVFIAMLVAILATGRFADPVDYFGPNLPADELALYPAVDGSGSGPGPADPTSQLGPAQLRAHARAIATSLGSNDLLALEAANVLLVRATDIGGPGTVYVATPALLGHYGINPDAIDPRTILITSRSGLQGTSGLRLLHGQQDPNAPLHVLTSPKIQTFTSLPTYAAAPNLLVTSNAVHELKLDVGPGGWLIHTPKALTALQINAARTTAAAAGMTIETKNNDPSLSHLRNYATMAGILLALGVLAMTVGLIRSEAVTEVRTLTATGASSSTRRTITASTAGALGLLGALLGISVAYIAAAAFFRSQLAERMGHVPVLDVLLLAIGLPLTAAAGGWLFAGHEPSAIAHQPLG
jgi:putative ABC transport system permease protein